jgi:hypothetical protein
MSMVMHALSAVGGGVLVKRTLLAVALYAVALLLGIIAILFGLFTVFLALAPAWGEVQAALLVALGVLVVAVLCAGLAAYQIRQAKRRAALLVAAAPIVTATIPVAAGVLKRAPALLALSALAVGFLAVRRR